ncbi:DUF72 domain-containing protein [Ramlibacter sp.]|uniref:DUF72 domain-containing protein n=1 Tax=Ramlibacter sp. TaxID=1917967 RepID=UPI002C469ADF|nr:DUF72 domain-containing protein [Ramlibacter sp.]HWI83752.1 DUF72 domain-containing protein [Ramlibacter sp.]
MSSAGASAKLRAPCFVGCASWSLPRDAQQLFPGEGSHLQRYARQLAAAEINSSFHRAHSHATYARWAASVPPGFRFAAKLPKTITHERKLRDCGALLHEFLGQASGLGDRLGCLLVQLPPSLAFDQPLASEFFAQLREAWAGPVCAEPRHGSWFGEDAQQFLESQQVARVLADPVRHAGGERPGGWAGLVYLRLHGAPRTYYSSYPAEQLAALARRMALALSEQRPVWCIFDNTAAGAATHNALVLQQWLDKEPA